MRRYTVKSMEECPRCKGISTGIIRPGPEYVSDTKRCLAEGHFVRYVDPEEYRNYYKPCGVNAFCRSCGVEFRGSFYELELTREEYLEYLESTGIREALDQYQLRTGKIGLLFDRIKRHLSPSSYLEEKEEKDKEEEETKEESL